MAKMLGYEPKTTKLVDGAVPTIFAHRTFSVINMNGEEIVSEERSQWLKNVEHTEVSNSIRL